MMRADEDRVRLERKAAWSAVVVHVADPLDSFPRRADQVTSVLDDIVYWPAPHSLPQE